MVDTKDARRTLRDERCTARRYELLLILGVNCSCAGHNGSTASQTISGRLTTNIRLDRQLCYLEVRPWREIGSNTIPSNHGKVGGGRPSSADKQKGAKGQISQETGASVIAFRAKLFVRAEEVDTDTVARAVIRLVNEEDGTSVCGCGGCGCGCGCCCGCGCGGGCGAGTGTGTGTGAGGGAGTGAGAGTGTGAGGGAGTGAGAGTGTGAGGGAGAGAGAGRGRCRCG